MTFNGLLTLKGNIPVYGWLEGVTAFNRIKDGWGTGIIVGDIHTSTISIEAGAIVHGRSERDSVTGVEDQRAQKP